MINLRAHGFYAAFHPLILVSHFPQHFTNFHHTKNVPTHSLFIQLYFCILIFILHCIILLQTDKKKLLTLLLRFHQK